MVKKMAFRHIATAFSVLTAGLFLLPPASIVHAQDGLPPPAETSILVDAGDGSLIDVMAASSDMPAAGNTHPMMRLTPDKSEIVRVDAPIRSLVVGNPAHLNILMDSTRTLVLVPREPGVTHFTALGDNGQVIMQRHVVVAGPQEKYVRIRRSCMNAGGGDCRETSVYYCPDICHPVNVMSADQGQPKNNKISVRAEGDNISFEGSPSAWKALDKAVNE